MKQQPEHLLYTKKYIYYVNLMHVCQLLCHALNPLHLFNKVSSVINSSNGQDS